jgi:murein L,D-transpeptidase YcbB/YkuD
MEFLNQVKKLKDTTKSAEVKALCENFLNGGSVSKELLIESLENHNISNDAMNNVQSHVDAIRNEEMEASRRVAESIMESWGGINNNRSLGNAGSYGSLNEAEMTDPAAVEKAYKPIKKGEKGDRVKELQIYLAVPNPDGIFGPALEAKVKEFQKANGLTADGMVGMATMKKIIEVLGKKKTLVDQIKEIGKKFISAITSVKEEESFLQELGRVSSIDGSAQGFLKSNEIKNP